MVLEESAERKGMGRDAEPATGQHQRQQQYHHNHHYHRHQTCIHTKNTFSTNAQNILNTVQIETPELCCLDLFKAQRCAATKRGIRTTAGNRFGGD